MTLKTTVSALALATMAAPAMAEMDAATLWQEWNQTYLRDVVITAGQTVQNDTEVRLSDVVVLLESGRDRIEISFPAFSLTETSEGGVVASIEGNGVFEAWPDNEEGPAPIVADLTIDGLSVGLLEGDGLEVVLSAPLLGAELTRAMYEGAPVQMEGAFSVADLNARVMDTGENGSDRRIEAMLSATNLTSRVMIREVEDIAAMDLAYDVSSVELEAMLDAPVPVFYGSERFEGDVDSLLRLAIGPSSMSAAYEQLPYDEGDESAFDMSLRFDAFGVDHAAYLPEGLDNYPDGRDLIPDDLEAHLAYELSNVAGHFNMVDRWGYDDTVSETIGSGTLEPSSALVRVEIDEVGMLSVDATSTASYAMDFEDNFQSERYGDAAQMDLFVQDMVSGLRVRAPLDNAMMAFMQGLPEGVEYRVNLGLAGAGLDYSESYNDEGFEEIATQAAAQMGATELEAGFTDQDAVLRLMSDQFALRIQEGMPGLVGGEVTDLVIEQNMPLNTGTGSLPYDLTLNVGSLVFDDALWDMAFPGRALDRSPMSLSARIDGQMRASTNPMSFVAFGMGASPFVVETMVFEAGASAVGVVIDAVGSFETERVVTEGVPPVGSADLSATGLDELLAIVSGMGVLPQDELDELAFFLRAFTVEQPGGERTMRVEINDQEHLIVNGVRLQ